jgi:hypothetical protein
MSTRSIRSPKYNGRPEGGGPHGFSIGPHGGIHHPGGRLLALLSEGSSRAACLAGIVALGVALIATGQHFLSDVIAGGYIGWVVFVCTDRGLTILGRGLLQKDP